MNNDIRNNIRQLDQDQEIEKGIVQIKKSDGNRRYRVNCQKLFLTYPQNKSEPEELLAFLKHVTGKYEPTYISVVRELHESGDPHLHAIVLLKKKPDIRDGGDVFGFPKHLGINISNIRNLWKSLEYVEKQFQPIDWGTKPIRNDSNGKKEICQQVLNEFNNTGKVDYVALVNQQPEVLTWVDKLKKNMELVHEQDQEGVQTIGRRCIFIIGDTGVGKSHAVREYVKKIDEDKSLNQQLYLKNFTQWFQGYKGQPNILIDDLDSRNIGKIFDEFKLWTDRYAARGQTKGGSNMGLKHKCIFITTQYGLDELMGTEGIDQKLLDALKRRFFIIDIRDQGRSWIWWVRELRIDMEAMNEDQLLREKRICLLTNIDRYYKQIEIEQI